MKATDQIYPPGVLIKDVSVTGIKARDFIAIEAMKVMLEAIYKKPVSMNEIEKIPPSISAQAYRMADAMITASE